MIDFRYEDIDYIETLTYWGGPTVKIKLKTRGVKIVWRFRSRDELLSDRDYIAIVNYMKKRNST